MVLVWVPEMLLLERSEDGLVEGGGQGDLGVLREVGEVEVAEGMVGEMVEAEVAGG